MTDTIIGVSAGLSPIFGALLVGLLLRNRLGSQRHKHEWGRWDEGDGINIYANGPGRLPTRQILTQTRSCKLCNEKQAKRKRMA